MNIYKCEGLFIPPILKFNEYFVQFNAIFLSGDLFNWFSGIFFAMIAFI